MRGINLQGKINKELFYIFWHALVFYGYNKTR